ncbi:MAG TPA: hypothetical protein VMT76_06865 [Puia sp.]|nr:hypothetical protein [Puia sp.]
MKELLKSKLSRLAKRYAEKLNKKAACYSAIRQKTGLALFCLLFTAVSIAVLIGAFSGKQNEEKIFELRTRAPAHIGKTFSMPRPVITKEDYERIEKFKAGIDPGMLKNRPHLLDSITIFEQLYQSQTKK